VFSHLYGPLPKQLIGKPAIINLYGNKREKAEEWCGASLTEVSKWAKGLTNTVYVANWSSTPLDLTSFIEDEFAPGRGWFPEAMVYTLLAEVLAPLRLAARPGVVFDGFMGRGTVGKVASALGLGFVGIDRDPERIGIAREYLGC